MAINTELIRSLGMTLIHSLWEGLVILVLLQFALAMAGKSNARLRYVILVSSLMFLLAGFFTTWAILYRHNIQSLKIIYAPLLYTGFPHLNGTTSWIPDPLTLISAVHQYLDPYYPLLALGWIVGFTFMAIKMAGGFYVSHNIIKRNIYRPESSLLLKFEKARSEMMVSARTQLRLSSRILIPMVIGIFKPCVIVPAAMLSGLTPEQVNAILVHELAHIRRNDHIVMIIQAIARQILFFHPAAWFISAEINRERENCCDDIVMKTFPNPINYIKALTMIQEMNVNGSAPAIALLGRSKHLLSRVKRLLKPETGQTSFFRLSVVLLSLIVLGIAAVTLANSGKNSNLKNAYGIFTLKQENSQGFRDSIKVKQSMIPGDEATKQDDLKKKKEMAEARRQYEKARIDMEKARIALERAREELENARGKLRSHDMVSIQEEAMQAMNEARFRVEHDAELQEHLNELNHSLSRAHSDMQEKMNQFRHEDWKSFRDEWQHSGDQINKAMQDFYRSMKDSIHHQHQQNMMVVPLLPPDFPPPTPPVPEIEIPELEMEIEMMTPGMENEQPETPDKGGSESLDSTLRELEK